MDNPWYNNLSIPFIKEFFPLALDLSLLGSKLRSYREQFKTSIVELSSATGIPEDSLIAFENGQQEPTGSEILILADFYKCDYKFFISNEKLAPFEQTETLFRMYGDELSKEDRWAIQEFLFLCEVEEFLMNQIPEYSRKSFHFVKQGNYYKGHGMQAAAELRRHLGYQPNQVPMNVYADFRRIGLHIFRRQLGNSNISGLFIRHPVAGKCVLVNYDEDVYRQRFTVAHEAAHAILDESDFVVSFAKWSQKDLSEIRANTFASCYLMPPEFLRKIPVGNGWSPAKAIEWASKLKVSTAALAKALKDTNLISDNVRREIRSIKVSNNDKIDPELPEALSSASRMRKEELLRRGLSGLYVDLCFKAYEGKIISYGRLAEILLVDEGELISIANLYQKSLS